ncbi:hypothetical protein AB2M62_00265 [Sphingomonas sp. MMS12-HWE2-04]|uniref:hypothetical protein n=1 Tax=Sphingomonas sp. MMS12-HWE2-04 TaxID=3234199 RepID=UPI0038514F3D
MRNARVLFALAAAALAAGAAGAEVIEVTGEFPAGQREASFLASIAVERFGGQDGPALQIALERALTGSQIEVLGGRAGHDRAEGAMSGAVSTSVEETPYKRKDKSCVEKNAKGKCIKEQEVEIRCRRRTISVDADIRIARNTDGRIVYSLPKPFREEVTWCEKQSPGRTAEETISAAIAEIAGDVRRDLVPRIDTYKIRVRESSKGLSKDAASRFKALVKLTKRDAKGACDGWRAMNCEIAGNPSILFNLALCAEQADDYPEAVALYQDAVRAGAGEGAEGANRVAQLIAGREDARERVRRRRAIQG